MASRDWQYSKRLAVCCYLVVFVATVLMELHVIRVVHAATVPGGFTDSLVVNGLVNPTAMEFAPDGRLFVCEQGGTLRVIKNGSLLTTPFLTVTVNSSGERGLLGVAFDPNFAVNHFVYVYYTATTPTIHNRISRFTASGDVAVPGSETPIFELDNLSSATNHNGGAIHFGSDGNLYVAVGDNANGNNAQSLATLHGKMLRISSNGGIPSNNPFFNQTTGNNRAIWALGLRNPFTFSIQPGTGRIFINDVGQNTTEEINDGIAGSNYGWPTCEGNCNPPNSNFRNPIYTYLNDPSTCAITGGTFYNPQTVQFPSTYVGNYFFADFCAGWIRKLDPANGNAVADFATGTSSPVDLKVSADGSLYYLARGTGAVHKIQYPANMQPPTIASHPQNQTVALGQSAVFSVSATGTPPFSYQWQRNGNNIVGATSSTYTLSNAQVSDNGAMFRAVVTNSFGSATSNNAQLTVTSNNPPTGNITQPTIGTLYQGGQTINYAGTGSDPEDGSNLPASAFTWRVDFHHDTHFHPFLPSTTGAKSGSFTIATTGETSDNVWYRIHLTVTDSGGLTHSSFRDILPRKSTVTLQTNPSGLQLKLDGQPVTAPHSFVGVVGIARTLEAVSPQTLGGTTYVFQSWSDGGPASHSISTPATDTSYTAAYSASPPPSSNLLAAYGFNEGTSNTTADASGNGHTATLVGATWTTGKYGQGLAFSGSNQYVTGTDIDFPSGPFTMSGWFRTSVVGPSKILSKHLSSTNQIYVMTLASGRVLAGFHDGTDWQEVITTQSFTDNAWHHFALVVTTSTVELFVDGVSRGTDTHDNSIPVNNVVWNIGRAGNNVQYFQGTLDEIKFYNKALTPAEVVSDMNTPLP